MTGALRRQSSGSRTGYAFAAAFACSGAAPPAAPPTAKSRARLWMVVAIIGYLYVFGARTGQDRFAVATILDRLVVPFLLVALVLTGELAPQLGLPFAFLDPVLGIGAWVVFARSQPSST